MSALVEMQYGILTGGDAVNFNDATEFVPNRLPGPLKAIMANQAGNGKGSVETEGFSD